MADLKCQNGDLVASEYGDSGILGFGICGPI